jgi:transposase
MRSNLFWLSDEQWERIEPHLPTDVRGVERQDDRRVISGIVQVLKSGCRWCDCPPNMARIRPSTIASYAGHDAVFGKTCSANLPGTDDPQTRR